MASSADSSPRSAKRTARSGAGPGAARATASGRAATASTTTTTPREFAEMAKARGRLVGASSSRRVRSTSVRRSWTRGDAGAVSWRWGVKSLEK